MMTGLDISVTKPDDKIRPRMGGNGKIPIIGFGPGDSTCTAQITVNHHCLTPVEQAAWLRKLAAAAEDLAEQVEILHGLLEVWTWKCTTCDAGGTGNHWAVRREALEHTQGTEHPCVTKYREVKA